MRLPICTLLAAIATLTSGSEFYETPEEKKLGFWVPLPGIVVGPPTVPGVPTVPVPAPAPTPAPTPAPPPACDATICCRTECLGGTTCDTAGTQCTDGAPTPALTPPTTCFVTANAACDVTTCTPTCATTPTCGANLCPP